MPRYIDADNITKTLLKEAQKLIDDRDKFPIEHGARNGYFSAISFIEWTESADVVPRSEVELDEIAYKSLKELYDNDTKELSDGIERLRIDLENAKQEVAREIFEEIEKLLDYHSYTQFFQGKICPTSYFEKDLEDSITELKKKYIGE